MLKFLAASVATFACSFAIACSMPPLPEPVAAYEIEVITDDGNVYVAGVGDDCRAAWQGAKVPHDWQQIRCIKSR